MRSVIKWAISNSPAMNTFLIAALIVGSISMVVMKREVFPAFNLEILLVTVPFPGATSAQVEDGICQKVESAVANVDGVRKMTSVAKEGAGFIILELNNDVTDVQKVLDEIRSQIEQISGELPPAAEKAEVKQIVFRAPSISVGLTGPPLEKGVLPNTAAALESERQLRALAEEVRKELLQLRPAQPKNPVRNVFRSLFQPVGPAVTSAEISAERPFEVSVEISEDALRQYGLGLREFANIIRQQNVDIPGGKMFAGPQEMVLRANNKQEDGEGISLLPAITKADGDVIRVGDIANVIDGFEETPSINLINGSPGLVIQVSKTNREDLFTVVETVKQYVAQKKVPSGYTISTWGDISRDVYARIDLLMRNGLQGLVLVFIVLAIFLDLRLAFWVAMGIPISILGAGFLLLAFGQSLNMLSLFSFLLALGIVVDDAIVIGENIYNKREEGLGFVSAAIEGTVEVLPSVMASVSTTIIFFVPLLFVSGVMGKFIAVMPLAVIAMLFISLVESMFILPAHLAHDQNLFMRLIAIVFYVFKPLIWLFTKLNTIASGAMEKTISNFYVPALQFCLNNRSITLASGLAFGILCAGLVAAGLAPVKLFPDLDGREINSKVVFPSGTSSSYSQAAIRKLAVAFEKLDEQVQSEGHASVIQNVYEKVGEVGDGLKGPSGLTSGSHVGSVDIQLTPPGERTITTRELINRWRKMVPKIAGSDTLSFGSKSIGPGGKAIEFKILADERGVPYLEEIADECKKWLATKQGVFDFEDDMRLGTWEQNVTLNQEGEALGMKQEDLAETVRSIYHGSEVQRLQIDRHEVKVMVRYPRKDRETRTTFEEIRVRDAQGHERPLVEIADVTHEQKLSEINRLDQLRSITVSADANSREVNVQELVSQMKTDFLPGLLEDYGQQYGANFLVNWEGEQASNQESIESMKVGFVIALFCMYIVLTLQFKSYMQPVIIMSIIPFGLLGAIIGHALLGLDLSLFTFFGLIALTGVVVNDSIVLVDFINRRVRAGMPLRESLEEAGRRRFRPIMLTSMTTIAGLFPMLLETSMQAQFLIPMAVSLIFGLLFGTLLILLLVPVFYSIYGSALQFLGFPIAYDHAHEKPEPMAVPPASI